MMPELPKAHFESLYLHFPFCETKCHYCDFYSLAAARTSNEQRAHFYSALERESLLAAPALATEVKTIFMGGGTPSMTPAEIMAQSLSPLGLSQKLASDYEWTMEANPSSITNDGLRGYRQLGVNRISVGVQSLQDHHLKNLGRVHNQMQALSALENIFSAGFDNVSADLICGVPGLTLTELDQSIDALLQFPLSHMSIYLLSLPPHHPMHAELPHEDHQLEQLLYIDRRMSERGFDHYEISNFCRRDPLHEGRWRSRHNLRYWQGQSWLGLGPSAHSYLHRHPQDPQCRPQRWKNHSSLHRYSESLMANKLPYEQVEVLSDQQLTLEKWMLRLRLSDGFPQSWLETPSQQQKLHTLIENGHIVAHPKKKDHYRLSPLGFALSDQIILELCP